MRREILCLLLGAAPACSDGAISTATAVDAPVASRLCNGSTRSSSNPVSSPLGPPPLTVPDGFVLEALASVGGARELAALPNGDLLVGTLGSKVFIIPNADGTGPSGKAQQFTSIADDPVHGVTFVQASCTIYIGSQHGLYAIPYGDGQLSASAGQPIASVRAGKPPAGSDGDVHVTTSVAFTGNRLFAGVGSSCNACEEEDPTRATIQQMNADGGGMTRRAWRFRNPIALAVNPATGTLWAGGAGQDNLPFGHPYEFFDAVTLHDGLADYGWPACEENQHPYRAGDCSGTVAPRIELPAYSTLIGAAFYPSDQAGDHAFPAAYRGGVFIAAHGSWHMDAGAFAAAPRVVYVPMDGDTPRTAVNWSDPTAQWTEFVGGFQPSGSSRVGKPTGISVGPSGTLFVADDLNGLVYRIRPR